MLFLCYIKSPVPLDQQPIQQYYLLNTSQYRFWILFCISKKTYIFTSVIVIGINLYMYIMYKYLRLDFNFFFSIIILSLISTLILALKLYFDCSYIGKRLISAIIYYEESGWYSAQIWAKNHKCLIKERLIGIYKIKPIINRLKLLIKILTLIIFSQTINIIIFKFVLCYE